jgi:hypothetical protein
LISFAPLSYAGFVSLRLFQREESETSVSVEFVVEDTGVGISEEILPTLFVPFRCAFLSFFSLSLVLISTSPLRQADTSTARQFGGSKG